MKTFGFQSGRMSVIERKYGTCIVVYGSSSQGERDADIEGVRE